LDGVDLLLHAAQRGGIPLPMGERTSWFRGESLSFREVLMHSRVSGFDLDGGGFALDMGWGATSRAAEAAVLDLRTSYTGYT
jgi:hypothetical protein